MVSFGAFDTILRDISTLVDGVKNTRDLRNDTLQALFTSGGIFKSIKVSLKDFTFLFFNLFFLANLFLSTCFFFSLYDRITIFVFA